MVTIRKFIKTEKAMRLAEFENTLVLDVDENATKEDVKKALEDLYNLKIDSIRVNNLYSTGKRMYVRLNKASKAEDVLGQ